MARTPIFKLGETFNSPFVGNPHLMAMEEAGIQAPKVEAAMRAAKGILGAVGNSNMGSETGDSTTDKIVSATARSALNHPDYLGPARIIRLGLFVDEYRKFRNTLAMKEVLDQLVEQKKVEYEVRARQWAGEVHQAITAGRKQIEVPWKKLLMFTGLGALVVGIFKILFGGRTVTSRHDEIDFPTGMSIAPPALPPPPPSAPRLAIAPEHQHHHHEEHHLEEEESQ